MQGNMQGNSVMNRMSFRLLGAAAIGVVAVTGIGVGGTTIGASAAQAAPAGAAAASASSSPIAQSFLRYYEATDSGLGHDERMRQAVHDMANERGQTVGFVWQDADASVSGALEDGTVEVGGWTYVIYDLGHRSDITSSQNLRDTSGSHWYVEVPENYQQQGVDWSYRSDNHVHIPYTGSVGG